MDEVRRRKLASRIVFGAFALFATAFILSSAAQLMSAVLGLRIEPVTAAPQAATTPPLTEPGRAACAAGIERLIAALDRAFLEASKLATAGAMSADGVVTAFQGSALPEWSEEAAIETGCRSDPHGSDAFAAVLRLRLAEESFLRRQIVELSPVRRDVQAYLPR